MNLIEAEVGRLSTALVRRLNLLWAQVAEGVLTEDEFITLATNSILSSNAQGYRLGAATVRSLVEQEVGEVEVTPRVVQPHHLDDTRISAALQTILADEVLETTMQLERMGDNEPKQSAADGSGDVLKGSQRVTGWVRSLDSQACELCTWWWREGRVWQQDHVMPRHTGCTCSQTPITVRTTNYQTEKQAAERRNDRRSSNNV